MEALCILPGEKVWNVNLDCHVLSDRGNLFDACGLAAITALRSAILPAGRFDVGEDGPLPVAKTPIICTYQRVGGRFVYDPDHEEELAGDERLCITLGDNGHLHSLQKGLTGALTSDEFDEMFDHAQKRTTELRNLIDEVVAVGDARFQEKCREELFARRADRAFIMASHDTHLVERECDRALILEGGQARLYDNVHEAVEAYGFLRAA